MQGNAIVRPSGTIDRDKEMLRLANSGGAQGEDRTLPIGVDGWEKSKMKKKRSGIKPEASPSFVSSKPTDGYRDQKQGMQQRPVTDGRPRSNNDTHGFRFVFCNCWYPAIFPFACLNNWHYNIHEVSPLGNF